MANKKIIINCFYVLESLRDDDTKTGLGLFNDVIKRRAEQLNIDAKHIPIISKDAFNSFFLDLERKVKNEYHLPYIHLEIHGNENGFQLNNDERISWEEFYEHLVRLNIPLKNNLVVSLGTCFGSSIFNIMHPMKRAPYYAFLAPIKTITENDIENDFLEYFNTLLLKLDFNSALEEIFKKGQSSKYLFYSSEMLFEHMLPFYYKEYDVKKKFRDIFQQSRDIRNLNRKDSRNQIKKHLKNRPEQIRNIKNYFLMKDLL